MRFMRWKAIGLIVIGGFLIAACSESTNTLTGAIAVTSGEFHGGVWLTARDRVSEDVLDCFEFKGSERTQCEEAIEPYIKATMHALDCSEGVEPGYEDINVGSRIVVSDASGDIVAVGNLIDAQIMELSGIMSCVYTFEAPSIPASDFYSVAIGGRDPLVYRADELELDGWDLVLYLGFGTVPTDSPRDYVRPQSPNGPPAFPPETSTTSSPPGSTGETRNTPEGAWIDSVTDAEVELLIRSVCADFDRDLWFSDIYDSRLQELMDDGWASEADATALWISMGNGVMDLCGHHQDRLPTEFFLPDECDTPCD